MPIINEFQDSKISDITKDGNKSIDILITEIRSKKFFKENIKISILLTLNFSTQYFLYEAIQIL